MAFKRKDLKDFARGDDWTVRCTIRDAEGQIVDITGYSYWMTLKSDVSSADPGQAQVGPVVAGSPDASSGIIYITMPKSQTASLAPGVYNYDIQQVDLSGDVTTLLLGKLNVVADITIST